MPRFPTFFDLKVILHENTEGTAQQAEAIFNKISGPRNKTFQRLISMHSKNVLDEILANRAF